MIGMSLALWLASGLPAQPPAKARRAAPEFSAPAWHPDAIVAGTLAIGDMIAAAAYAASQRP